MMPLRMYRGSSPGDDPVGLDSRSFLRVPAFLAVMFCCQTLASGQSLTQMYSFEPPGDLDGFTVNGALSTFRSTQIPISPARVRNHSSGTFKTSPRLKARKREMWIWAFSTITRCRFHPLRLHQHEPVRAR